MNQALLSKLFETNGPLKGEQLENIASVSGGCINQAWRIALNSGKVFFAKTGNKKMLHAEAIGLKALKTWANDSFIKIPTPVFIDDAIEESVLVLPWLELTNGDQSALGHGLALLHQQSANNNPGKFGWSNDAFIGAGPQPGGWISNWGEHFVKLRLMPQMKIASQWGLRISDFSSTLSALIPFLNEHKARPSIVHGDLWSGNVGILSDSRGVLLDPATWWGDREVDIAMTKLFGGFSNKFYDAYKEVWPLEQSADKRIAIYNLYHLLNHANLFGGSYKESCYSSLKALEKKIPL